MAVPRGSSTGRVVRGTRARGEAAALRRPGFPGPAPISDPARPRAVIDYALTRRAVLAEWASRGRRSADVGDLCDADPYLVRAAQHYGQPTERPCPVCTDVLTDVTYVFGDDLGPLAGSASAAADLADLATSYGEFGVFVVEVCIDCGWNHLRLSYTLGDGRPRRSYR